MITEFLVPFAECLIGKSPFTSQLAENIDSSEFIPVNLTAIFFSYSIHFLFLIELDQVHELPNKHYEVVE